MLKEFEKKIIKLLAANIFSSQQLEEIIQNAIFIGYEYTGSGYFISIRHPDLPKNRLVCSQPTIIGEFNNIESGFVIFVENNELTIECHSWGETNVPKEFRDKDIQVKVI